MKLEDVQKCRVIARAITEVINQSIADDEVEKVYAERMADGKSFAVTVTFKDSVIAEDGRAYDEPRILTGGS